MHVGNGRDLSSARNFHQAEKQREARSKQGSLCLQVKEGSSVYIWKDGNHEEACLVTVDHIDARRGEVVVRFKAPDSYSIFRERLIAKEAN